ncbi:MAG TPA: ribonuclease HII [Alphaproteobacteria bacterium]
MAGERGPDYAWEAAVPAPVCGVDEAGRGPLAGPVVAAAVILAPGRIPAGIDDSKRLAPARRAALDAALRRDAEVALGIASVDEIDILNVLQASLLAMARAVAGLPRPPASALIDGTFAPALACPARALVRGDARSLSIAAASIVAKCARDRIMAELALSFPGYGWETNAGYGTPAHLAALARLGPSPHHRRGFAPVRAAAGLARGTGRPI